MWENAVDVLAALHQVPADRFPFLAASAGVSGFADHLGFWRDYLDRSTAGSPHDTLEAGYEWLVAHMPSHTPTGFSWGDSRFANIMFRGTDVVAIFDWDTVSLAGAEADLAWWRFMDGPSAELVPGIGDRDELVRRWQERTGREVHDLEYYDLFTEFRLGCILLRLFGQLGASGAVPPEVAAEQGRNSGPSQALAAHLDQLR
jgi:aminoglycoside phosphotransferase (APT) family kinase protein